MTRTRRSTWPALLRRLKKPGSVVFLGTCGQGSGRGFPRGAARRGREDSRMAAEPQMGASSGRPPDRAGRPEVPWKPMQRSRRRPRPIPTARRRAAAEKLRLGLDALKLSRSPANCQLRPVEIGGWSSICLRRS